jgi:hypothetical protein
MNICCQFLVQTNPNWELTVMYDGEIPEHTQDIMDLFGDKRIHFKHSKQRNGLWGHPNRKKMIQDVKSNENDFILLTNEDNMYVPIFVDAILSSVKKNTGFIMCDFLQSYIGFMVFNVKLKENHIDMGSFAVKSSVVKKVGFNHLNFSADGKYAEDCGKYCNENNLEILHIKQPLFIHC